MLVKRASGGPQRRYRLAAPCSSRSTSSRLGELDADVVAVAPRRGRRAARASSPTRRGAGDAKAAFKKLALLHPERPARVLVVGLGEPDELDAERLRVAAALAAKRAATLDATLARLGRCPTAATPAERGAALVEGTILAAYRFDRYRSRDADDSAAGALERLVLVARARDAAGRRGGRDRRSVAAEAANRARDAAEPALERAHPGGARRARRGDRRRPRASSRSRSSTARRSPPPGWAA